MRKVDSGKGLILTLERSTTFIQVHRKENLETLEAINYLSAKLGIFPSDFSYTGIKDKRAITYQAVVKKVTPQRLKELGNAVEKKGLGVSHIYSVSQSLRLCQLQGNQFDIIVRDLKLHNNEPTSSLKEQICEAIENVKKNGFINYYGSQRFGQGQNIQINQTGLALLNEEMVKSVKLFFTPEDSNDPVNKAKKYFLQTGGDCGVIGWLFRHQVEILSCCHSERLVCTALLYATSAKRQEVSPVILLVVDEAMKVHMVTAVEEMDNKYTINQVDFPFF
ncbi:pseudouridylate synthase 7 homolog-like protein isoform X4 [Crotalus tigris]|uniref:pseudouridylate synthase 7 homolog-like protein isoform X4 n=1 Tax=Crotalus tigris TaxID=88082 RepID=UPI00192FAA13|nr:pseudouridylate synthase 7 homolog-like protein isoform X4 [Crotalus tigris]